MAGINFVDHSTFIPASWAQAINDFYYNLFQGCTTAAQARAAIGISDNSSNVTYNQGSTGATDRTVTNKLQEVISAKDFGVIGDGVTNDTTAMRNFLLACAGKIGYIPPGTYLCNSLKVASGTTLVGAGRDISILKAIGTLSNSESLLSNINTNQGGVDVFPDKNIRIEDLTIDGNNLGGVSRLAEITGFSKVENLTFNNVRITNHRWFGLYVAGCKEVKITNCKADALGDPTTGRVVAGPALSIGSDPFDGTHSSNVLVEGNTVQDCYEAGILINSDFTRVANNYIKNVKEGGIVVGDNKTDITVINNDIDTVGRSNISSSGIEVYAQRVSIINNRIKNIGSVCIAVQESQDIIVMGNVLKNTGQEKTYFTQPLFIALISVTLVPKNILVTGNIARQDSGQPTAYAFLQAGNVGPAFTDTLIEGNNAGTQTFDSGKGILWDATKRGTNCITRNNMGCSDINAKVGEFSAQSATGAQSITGIGFRPSRLEIHAVKGGSVIEKCDTLVNPSGICVGSFYATNGTNSVGNATGNHAILLYTPGSVIDYQANFTSYDDDGFTLNVTTGGFTMFVQYVAYP